MNKKDQTTQTTTNTKPETFEMFRSPACLLKNFPQPIWSPQKENSTLTKKQKKKTSRLGPPSKKNNVSFRNQWQSFQSPVHSLLPQGFRSWINLGEGFCVLKPGRPFRLKPRSRTLKWHESPAFIHKSLTTESCHRHGKESTHFLSAWDNGSGGCWTLWEWKVCPLKSSCLHKHRQFNCPKTPKDLSKSSERNAASCSGSNGRCNYSGSNGTILHIAITINYIWRSIILPAHKKGDSCTQIPISLFPPTVGPTHAGSSSSQAAWRGLALPIQLYWFMRCGKRGELKYSFK